MVFNVFTQELLLFLEGNAKIIRKKELILNHVVVKKEIIKHLLLYGAIGAEASSIQKSQMLEFVDDLEFIEDGLNGHWFDVFTFPNSQEYYHALQKKIEFIISLL